MKLYIDTSDRNKIVVGIEEQRFESEAKDGVSQKLVSFIDEVLEKNKLTTKDITQIEVNTGPGSFTGLRVGVAVANAMGFALHVPVNGQLTGEKEIHYK